MNRRCRRLPAAGVALAVAILVVGDALPSATAATKAPVARRAIVGYYAAWSAGDRHFFIRNLEENGAAERLTHIQYAFANVGKDLKCAIGDPVADYQRPMTAAESVDGKADGGTGLRGNFNQLLKLKAAHPHLKALISIGGWTWSDKFSDAALTDASRQTFVKSCVDMFIRGELEPDVTAPGVFDGIDVDWEFPGSCGNTCAFRAEDTANFAKLMAEFRSELDALGAHTGKHYFLSIATSARAREIEKLDLKKLNESLDFVSIMTYDFHVAAAKISAFHAGLYGAKRDPAPAERLWADAAVRAHIKGGIPAAKLMLGVPFYGHGWQVPPGPAGDGLFQTVKGPAPSTETNGSEDATVLLAHPTGKRFFHKEAQAMWTYDPQTQIFWTFDDPATLAIKTKYVKDKKLGGMMLWDLAGDTADGVLLKAMRDGLD
jgi:chitinase